MKNTDIINKFFNAYGSRDMKEMRESAADDIIWSFPGRNPLSGTKKGIEDVITFLIKWAALWQPPIYMWISWL